MKDALDNAVIWHKFGALQSIFRKPNPYCRVDTLFAFRFIDYRKDAKWLVMVRASRHFGPVICVDYYSKVFHSR